MCNGHQQVTNDNDVMMRRRMKKRRQRRRSRKRKRKNIFKQANISTHRNIFKRANLLPQPIICGIIASQRLGKHQIGHQAIIQVKDKSLTKCWNICKNRGRKQLSFPAIFDRQTASNQACIKRQNITIKTSQKAQFNNKQKIKHLSNSFKRNIGLYDH